MAFAGREFTVSFKPIEPEERPAKARSVPLRTASRVYGRIVFGASAILFGVVSLMCLAMRLLATMTALFGLLVWVPMIAARSATLSNWSEISENYLIAAAAWLVADLQS
jgi:hypothetical protein